MHRSSFSLGWFLATFLIVVGCDGSSGPGPIDGGPWDAGDGGTRPECPAIAPIVGGTTDADAIADAPPRCAAPSSAWLRSDQLGEIVARQEESSFTRALLRGLAAGANITLPRDPEHDVRTETIAYVTQDRGALVQSSALVAYPSTAGLVGQMPILLFLHGTSGFRASCGPSADDASRALAAVLASYGWIVVAPDYLGMESLGEPYGAIHPYLVGEATAIASLDSARAVARLLADDPAGTLCASSQVAVFGGSQGGHATLWVDRLAPYYARELQLIGSVAAVPTADLVGQAQRALTTVVPATMNFTAIVSTEAPWYGAPEVLSTILVSPYDADIPAALAASCSPGGALDEPATLDALFTASFLDAVAADGIANVDPVGCWLREGSLTETSVPRLGPSDPSYGILFVVAGQDQLIHPPIEQAAYDTLCAGGMPLQYLECEGASHTQGTVWALPEILDFLDARRSGEAFAPECTRPAAVRCRGTPTTM